MKPITMYQAEDGSIWKTATEAVLREEWIDRCRAVEEKVGLRPRPDDIDFLNGEGYVQHPEGARDALLEELKGMGAHRDSEGPVGDLLHRMWNMDDQDREWGQTYYALHPDEGAQVEMEVDNG